MKNNLENKVKFKRLGKPWRKFIYGGMVGGLIGHLGYNYLMNTWAYELLKEEYQSPMAEPFLFDIGPLGYEVIRQFSSYALPIFAGLVVGGLTWITQRKLNKGKTRRIILDYLSTNAADPNAENLATQLGIRKRYVSRMEKRLRKKIKKGKIRI